MNGWVDEWMIVGQASSHPIIHSSIPMEAVIEERG
jgi:hypothetical protein